MRDVVMIYNNFVLCICNLISFSACLRLNPRQGDIEESEAEVEGEDEDEEDTTAATGMAVRSAIVAVEVDTAEDITAGEEVTEEGEVAEILTEKIPAGAEAAQFPRKRMTDAETGQRIDAMTDVWTEPRTDAWKG